jgi:ribosome-binding protein aMBF1 (putative translation factor)
MARQAGHRVEEEEAMSITPAECKTARKLVGWSQHDLAAKLLLTTTVICRFETRERLWSLNLAELERLLEAAGVEFTDDEDSVRLKAKSRTIAAEN